MGSHFEGFNNSVWHALVILPLGVGVYLWAFLSLKKRYYYFFDPKHNNDEKFRDAGDFEPHSKRYHELARLVITLSAAAIAFLVSLLVNDKSASTSVTSPYAHKLESVAPIVVGFFGLSIALSLSFMLFQTLWYEEYCHSTNHSTYTRGKYAFSYASGVTGLCSFVLGFIWLAVNLFEY